MTKSERWLVLLLRLGAVLTGSAVLAVFLPAAWMAAIHRSLGLGELLMLPITSYLTRSLSAMYALHGLILLALSLDVARSLRLVTWVGWGTAALGVFQLGIDLGAPLPLWWTLAEGPWVIAAGLLLVWLARRVKAERVVYSVEGGIPIKKART